MTDWGLVAANNEKIALNLDSSNSRGTALTVPGSNNTKGAYLQLVASTGIAAGKIIVGAELGGLSDNLVDIAIGAASSEQVILPDLVFSGRSELFNAYVFDIPIPAGTRVAARYQTSNTTTGTLYLTVHLLGGHWLTPPGHNKVLAYGADATDSGGTVVDPGSTANTKGSWAQIVASTTRRIRRLHIGLGNRANNVRSFADYLLDIGIGASTSEQVIIPDLALIGTQNELIASNCATSFLVDIPAGTRLAARAQCSITDATDRLLDLVIHGEE